MVMMEPLVEMAGKMMEMIGIVLQQIVEIVVFAQVMKPFLHKVVQAVVQAVAQAAVFYYKLLV